MAPWFLPCLGLAGPGLPWTCSPSTCAFGGVGSPLSLLRLGLSWRLGFGIRPASRVGAALVSLPHPSCFLSAVALERERRGPPARQTCLLSLAVARASLFGVSGRSWGLEPNRHGVRLLVSAGLHPPVRQSSFSVPFPSNSLRRMAPDVQGLLSHHSSPRHHGALNVLVVASLKLTN